MKKIVIFGSTGMTGLCALEAAVKKGLQVRAFVRNPDLVPDKLKNKVEIIQGNVLEPDSVHEAVEGMDGVVVILGTRNSLAQTSDMSEGMKNIIDAMRAHNVKPVSACMSCFLLYEPEKVPAMFVNVNKDHDRMYQALKESPLNWIAVLPPHISEDGGGEVIITVNPKESPGRVITKYDLAEFMVDCISKPEYYKSTIGIANVPKK